MTNLGGERPEPKTNQPQLSPDDYAHPRVIQYQRAVKACEKLFTQKNAEYDDTIAATGVLGASVELIGVTARLKKMVLRAEDAGASNQKELIEIGKDIVNYGAILMMMAADNNWRGE